MAARDLPGSLLSIASSPVPPGAACSSAGADVMTQSLPDPPTPRPEAWRTHTVGDAHSCRAGGPPGATHCTLLGRMAGSELTSWPSFPCLCNELRVLPQNVVKDEVI